MSISRQSAQLPHILTKTNQNSVKISITVLSESSQVGLEFRMKSRFPFFINLISFLNRVAMH